MTAHRRSRPVGRPRKGTAPERPPFWRTVTDALAARAEAEAAGPRTLLALASAVGIGHRSINYYASGTRQTPAHVEAAVRAALPEMPFIG